MATQGSGMPRHLRGSHTHSSSSWTGSGFPFGGSAIINGHQADSTYDPVSDAFNIDFMGRHNAWHTIDLQMDPQRAMVWCEKLYQSLSQQPKGQFNVSGQSSQHSSGGPLGAYAGGGSGGQSTAQQAATAAHQAANQLAQYKNQLTQKYAIGSGGSGWIAVDGECYTRPEPLKDGGLKLGEIIGWRGWRITTEGFLHSMSADVLWAPGEPMYGNVKASIDHNGCYAYKHARDFLKKHAGGLQIYGKVAMWGRVIEHELGYRAEWAKIISLDELLGPHTLTNNIRALRKRYGVEAA